MSKKSVDISKYISADAPELVLFGKTYKIKNDKNTILKLNAVQREAAGQESNEDLKADETILVLLLGESEANEILDIINNSPNYAENERIVLLNVMALATGQKYEDLEARFQKAAR